MNPKLKVKTRILVLSLFSIFTSCTDELYNIKEQHTGLDKNNISLAQFKKETTIAVLKPIISVPKTTSITSKGKLQLNDFSIDTLAIKKFIAKNNQTTYTFRIYPLSFVAQPNEIYNLVYRKVNTSWETAIFYIKKLPKENSDHKLFEKIERIDVAKVANAVTSKSSLTTSNSGSGMFSYESLTIECDGSCDRQGYSECDGFACPTGQCVERSITYMYCNLEDYSGGGGGSGGTYGGTGGSEGGGNGSTYSGATTGSATLDPFTYFPNDLDSPFYEDPMYINSIKRAYIWDNLGNAKQRFFASNPEYLNYFNETIQYQINSNWSVESNELGNWAREFKFDNPDTTWEDVIEILDASRLLEINAKEVWNNRNEYRNNMSEAEKVIFDNMLPNRRMLYLASGYKAKEKANELYPNSLHNGKGDAFRHCYWNALSSKFIGVNLTNQLTTAHEDKPFTYPYEQKEKDMDLYNNNIGQNIANYVSILDNIEQEVLTQLNYGFLRYLSNLNSNSLPTYQSFLTPTNQ
jgi:uncharacterized membrane protein YgcG